MASKDSVISTWTKYTLFFTCFLIFLTTGAIGAVVSYYLSTRDDLKIDYFLDFIRDWSCLILVLASLLFIMAFFGWLGALREYRTSLLVFKIILGFLMLLQVALMIVIFLLAFNEGFRKLAYDEDLYRDAIAKYRDPEYQSLHETIDAIQEDWECCGVSDSEEGYKDWTYNEYFNCSAEVPPYRRSIDYCSVPFSCCIKQGTYQNIRCGEGMVDPTLDEATRSSKIHTRGCFLALTEQIKDNIMWIGIVCLCILVPQVIGYVLAGNLRNQISVQRQRCLASQANFDRISVR